MKTRTSQVRSPRGMIGPALPAMVPHFARIVVHNWHTFHKSFG